MSFTINFKEEAVGDIAAAYKWYESRRKGLGEEYLNEIEEYIKTIKLNPLVYQVQKHNWRYCPLKRFPFLIIYEIEGSNLIVYAVFNTYQHPKRLNKRKK